MYPLYTLWKYLNLTKPGDFFPLKCTHFCRNLSRYCTNDAYPRTWKKKSNDPGGNYLLKCKVITDVSRATPHCNDIFKKCIMPTRKTLVVSQRSKQPFLFIPALNLIHKDINTQALPTKVTSPWPFTTTTTTTATTTITTTSQGRSLRFVSISQADFKRFFNELRHTFPIS